MFASAQPPDKNISWFCQTPDYVQNVRESSQLQLNTQKQTLLAGLGKAQTPVHAHSPLRPPYSYFPPLYIKDILLSVLPLNIESFSMNIVLLSWLFIL